MKLQLIKNPVQEFKKKFWLRAGLVSFTAAGVVMFDELIKEGYTFNPNDLVIIGSHESITLSLIAFGWISLFIHALKRVKSNGPGESQRESEEKV